MQGYGESEGTEAVSKLATICLLGLPQFMVVLIIMASKFSVSTFPFSPSSSSACSRPAPSTSPSSSILYPRTPKFRLSLCNFPLGLGLFSPWNGLKHLGISNGGKFPERRKRIPKGKAVFASLFGVGAPEALVIGVVALLVFGPKGLAEVARNLGKTLRAFQPTIRELQDVSREFKTSLEREIGLDEISSSVNSSYNSSKLNTYSDPPPVPKAEESVAVAEPNDSSSASKAYTSEEYLKVTEEQLNAQDQLQTNFAAESQSGSQVQPEGTIEEPTTAAPELQNLGTGKAEESPASVPRPPGTES
ncbi:sec-independent protein translocase protein TATB, chloroplastic isoform X2 [Benincasa hispida]|uniref:sec-independent protein translocase protein TATB, chloroplastic isoform X2 n=1 Tax=Benincasa hispida TaxID=102211 RepID=UPI0019022561|nr:sec-independent protein translocase protein TATB, chloroplastic isoform X2 [Benincasa hispida]